MKIASVVTELRGVGLEVVLGIIIKVFSVLLSLLLIPKISMGESYFLELTYAIGLVNMAKVFDGSLPYLQRLNHPRGYGVRFSSELKFSILVYTAHIIIFWMISSSFWLALSLALFGKIYGVANYRFNVTRRSYFFYLQHTVALATCLLLPKFGEWDPAVAFISVSLLVVLIGLWFEPSDVTVKNKLLPLKALWTTNVSMNLVTMLVFFFYAEFAAVFLYGYIPILDYAAILTFTKISLLLVGAASAISTPLWNYANDSVGKLDRLSISRGLYVPLFVLGGSGYLYFAFFDVSESVLFGYSIELLCLVFIISCAGMGNLFVSQILARVEMSKELLVMSSLELLCMIFILVTYSGIENYLLLWMLLVTFKFLSGTYIVGKRR